ncbi:hypothetical protein Hanom_Chr17g01557941 [Helianthus anomalus]
MLSDLINTLKIFEMDMAKIEMNQVGYSPKFVQSVAPKNMAFVTPINVSGSISQAIPMSSPHNGSSSAGEAPSSSDKAPTGGVMQALKIPTEQVALSTHF